MGKEHSVPTLVDPSRLIAMTHYFLGNNLSEQEKYDGAIEEFTMAVQEKPDFASGIVRGTIEEHLRNN
jgi:hypothetical protein